MNKNTQFRGKKEGHDVDILISHPNKEMEKDLLHKIIEVLGKSWNSNTGYYVIIIILKLLISVLRKQKLCNSRKIFQEK